ncbi:MAG: HEAT repeat domain-containing protein [Desulfobacterales bacterium]|nr:HEAT repeat domain-containing protein [Desulfobacterales bacterium]
MTKRGETDNIVLKGIAATLNGCGRFLVWGYDMGVAGPGIARTMIKTTSESAAGLCRKASDVWVFKGKKGAGSHAAPPETRDARSLAKAHEKEYRQVLQDIDEAITSVAESLPPGDFEAVEQVLLDLFDHDTEIKSLAATYLGETKDAALAPVLVAALGFCLPELTDAVLIALGRMDTGILENTLEEMAESPEKDIRLAAVVHLDKFSSPDKYAKCLERLSVDPDKAVRNAAADAPRAPAYTRERLSRMVKARLVDVGGSLGLKLNMKMKKDELIRAIMNHGKSG